MLDLFTFDIASLAYNTVFIVVAIFVPLFYFWMLIDAIFSPIKNKVFWVIIILIGLIIGATLYFFLGRNDRIIREQEVDLFDLKHNQQ